MRTRFTISFCCTAVALIVASPAWPADAEKELVFACYGETLGQALKSTVIVAFEKQYGVKVVFLTAETVNMIARVRAQAAHPQIDVVAGTDASHAIGDFPNFADL